MKYSEEKGSEVYYYFGPGHKTSRNWSRWCAFLFSMKINYTTRWHLFASEEGRRLLKNTSFNQSPDNSQFNLML